VRRLRPLVRSRKPAKALALNVISVVLAFPDGARRLVSCVHNARDGGYVGHAEKWDELAIDGDIAGKDCLLRFIRNGRTLAVASIFRDIENLQAELAMEREASCR
jgi:hypothetical protein